MIAYIGLRGREVYIILFSELIMLFCRNNNHYITKSKPNPNRRITLTPINDLVVIGYFWVIDHWFMDHGIDIPGGA